MPLIEIIFTCWLILLPNGDAFCYCQGETPPAVSSERTVTGTRSPPDYHSSRINEALTRE